MFGLNALHEKSIHGRIHISKVVLTYIKGNTGFDEAVKNPEKVFMLFGNKEKNNPLH